MCLFLTHTVAYINSTYFLPTSSTGMQLKRYGYGGNVVVLMFYGNRTRTLFWHVVYGRLLTKWLQHTRPWNEHGRHFGYTTNCLPLFEKSEVPLSSSRTSMPCEPPGNHSCGAPTCKTCPILVTSDEFSSHTTGKSFKVKIQASCKSSNVIYLITCRRCGHQYVGEKASRSTWALMVTDLASRTGGLMNLLCHLTSTAVCTL